MKAFDLKKFRGQSGLNQQDFAKKINRSQGTVSRIESGEKPVTDKFLDMLSKAFEKNLEEYKSYNQQEEEEYAHKAQNPQKAEALELLYLKLLEDKSKMDDRFFTLSEKYAALESSLIKENNALLKKIAANTEELLSRLQPIEK